MRLYFDTSVIVASSVASHPHYVQAVRVIRSATQRGWAGFASTHGLAEAYSVLTRIPLTPQIHPSEAWRILEATVLGSMTLVSLSAAEYKELVRRCSVEGHAGGKVYDAIHIRCAQKANCDRLYTFDTAHFLALAPEDFRDRIVAP